VGLVVQDLYSLGVTETGAGGSGAARAMARLEGGVLRSADGVAAIHDRFRDRIVEHLAVPREGVTVIRNWTHVTRAGAFNRAQFRRALGWGESETVVLHAGAMGAKQGLENVVEAARSADGSERPVRFVLMGDGSRRAELERLGAGIRSLEFRNALDKDDFPRALAAADLLLVNERPGVTEMAVPSKLTSYFSSGTAVVAATEAGSTTAGEVAAAGAGVRVQPGQPQLLLDTVLGLGSDPEKARTLGANGPRYVNEVLSRETAIQKYDEWIHQLAERRDRRGEGQHV
jgi:glycosyltransferase involved in cell wall biosynthesis